MAGHAERHVVRLILHQHSGLRSRMRLMAGQAVDRLQDLVQIARVHDVADGMPVRRVTVAVLDGQQDHLSEVVFWQLDFTVENRDLVFGFEFLRVGIGPMALEAQLVRARGSQQVHIVATVWLVTGRATLHERRLVQVRFLHLIGLIAVAGQTGADRIGLQESR